MRLGTHRLGNETLWLARTGGNFALLFAFFLAFSGAWHLLQRNNPTNGSPQATEHRIAASQ
jgi:hypothetical protein